MPEPPAPAQAHRAGRVRSDSEPTETVALLLLSALAALLASTARAQPHVAAAPDRAQLEHWAAELRAPEPEVREEAWRRLTTLPAEALPAIDARLAYTRRQEIPEEDGYDALRAFRHAMGSLRADDMVDIAPGVLPALAERRDPVIARTAERLAYLRSMEALGSHAALRRVGDVLALTPRMWRWERRRLVARAGLALGPALVSLTVHGDTNVRVWAGWGLRQLGLQSPGAAVQSLEGEGLADLFGAYADARDFDAMPVIVDFVGHRDRALRDAARAAMERFAHNGIWQLRRAFKNQLGREADPEWGWVRTQRELYDGLDAERLAPITEALDAALAASGAAALAGADAVLQAAPLHPRRHELAPVYAGAAPDAEPAEARRLLRRALALAPEAVEARTWTQRLGDVERRLDAARGVEFDAPEAAPTATTGVAPAGPADAAKADEAALPRGLGAAALLASFCVLLALGWRLRHRLPTAPGSFGTRYRALAAALPLPRRRGRGPLQRAAAPSLRAPAQRLLRRARYVWERLRGAPPRRRARPPAAAPRPATPAPAPQIVTSEPAGRGAPPSVPAAAPLHRSPARAAAPTAPGALPEGGGLAALLLGDGTTTVRDPEPPVDASTPRAPVQGESPAEATAGAVLPPSLLFGATESSPGTIAAP